MLPFLFQFNYTFIIFVVVFESLICWKSLLGPGNRWFYLQKVFLFWLVWFVVLFFAFSHLRLARKVIGVLNKPHSMRIELEWKKEIFYECKK